MNARFAAFLAALAIASGSVDAALPRVHPGVHRALRNDGTVNLILELAQTTESTLESFKESAFFSRSTKIDALKSKLQAQSQVAASEVTKFLSQESTGLYSGFKSFWISNQVYVENASFDLVEKLAALDSIGTIREQFVVKIDKPEVVDDIKKLVGQEWDVKIIGAPKVWADGNIGQDVVVASLDTGVRWTHEALKQNFRGAYSWYDPEFKTDEPYDVDIHGTHAMGTIASTNGVGVAPGATWMSYKICRVEDCYEANMLELQQSAARCEQQLGFYESATFFKAAVDAWTKAGIVLVFAVGNSGPECRSAGSPADFPSSIAVGATTSLDQFSVFSSKGPGPNGHRKPDLVAPGGRIRSAVSTGNSDYKLLSGTSMSVPHVAGAVALILSAQPDFTIDEVKIALYTTTDQKGLGATNATCGGTSDFVWLNNQYGHGRVNVLNVYEGFRPAP